MSAQAKNPTVAPPTALGLKKSFGFGDRLGLATSGHLTAAQKYDFAPIYAQQSIREMQRTNRTPEEVMSAAKNALAGRGYSGQWGADADHLKTAQDVQRTAAAGFCFFTIDPSAYVVNGADSMPEARLNEAVGQLVTDRIFENAWWEDNYLGRDFQVDASITLKFDQGHLRRAAVKYARAINYSALMAKHIADANRGKDFEIEVSVDETDSPTSAVEHLFFGLELKRRGVKVVSLAPRFIGEMEKGIDYRGDLNSFEKSLKEHVAIAKHCGPYKISVHSGSDKFSIYPIVGRVCGELLHVKTAGTSYLEALRVIARKKPQLFREIADFCHHCFSTDRASYHISTTDGEVAALGRDAKNLEREYLDERAGRQLMHVTFGSVLTKGRAADGRSFKEAILETLAKENDLHEGVLVKHFEKHLALLNAG